MNRARHNFMSSVSLAFLFVARLHAQGPDLTVVKTESGAVRGVAKDGVISWKRIPYAAPPAGKLRWRVPQPAIAWAGIHDASQFGPACMQTDDLPKSEDCLTLNVWKPVAASGPLPLMVWIYGGAMVHGNTAMYPGDALSAEGVVVVSMNYRMGRLGFFAHPELAAESPKDVRGNYGYMDQLAALKWVQRNIAAFGGNPKQVTIFGESAGGGSVMSHLESPMSCGLFQGAILQSPGTPGARAKEIPTTDLSVAERMAVEWARSVGVAGDGAAALEQLRALPARNYWKVSMPSRHWPRLPPALPLLEWPGRFWMAGF
jgi:para-nitrobenzyl esterase